MDKQEKPITDEDFSNYYEGDLAALEALKTVIILRQAGELFDYD